jgi:hypothetical protein
MAQNVPVQMQPLDIEDFSGGLTDNFFDGGPTRAADIHNFFVTVDKRLIERDGTIPYSPSNCIMPGPPRRVDTLITFINETQLLVNQGRSVFSLPSVGSNPTWTEILGPSGNAALPVGGQYSIVTHGEFQRQLYLASDAQGIPSRIYRDQNLAWQVRTAGLPRVDAGPNFTNSSLLIACITNVNALRASFLLHIQDAAGSSGITTVNLHTFVDTVAYALVNPVPAAFDAPSVYALVYALAQAFSEHNLLSEGIANFHMQPTDVYGNNLMFAPLAPLNSTAMPTDLVTAAAMIDDMYQKYYWHQLAINLHGTANNTYSQMNRYIITNPKIGVVNLTGVQAPTITPSLQDYFNFVNGIQCLYNGHLGSSLFSQLMPAPYNSGQSYPGLVSFAHKQPDAYNTVTLPIPFATSEDSAALLIAWMRMAYNQQHIETLGAAVLNIQFTCTSGSPNISNLKTYPGGVELTTQQLLGKWLFVSYTGLSGPAPFVGTPSSAYSFVAKINSVSISGGVTSATLDRNVTVSSSFLPPAILSGTLTSNLWHGNWSSSGTANANVGTGTFPPPTAGPGEEDGSETLPASTSLPSGSTAIGQTLTEWNAYAIELFDSLAVHITDDAAHYIQGVPNTAIQTFNNTNTPGITQWFIPTIASLAYAFTYSYEYTVEPDGLKYLNESNPVYSQPVLTVEPFPVGYIMQPPTQFASFFSATTINVIYPIVISGIPSIVNDELTNYDTANIYVNIYRTINSGTTYYGLEIIPNVGVTTTPQTIPNGTTSFNDVSNDTLSIQNYPALPGGQAIYTSGGVVGNDQPPACRYCYVLNGVAYYANILEDGQEFPNQYRQSNVNNLDSVPQTFSDTLDDTIVGMGANRSLLILFCSNSIYNSQGLFTETGTGQLTHQKISQRIGCLSAKSIVQTEIGLFFAGNDGFYYTDGYQLIKVSIDLNQSYQSYTQSVTQRLRICGEYDKLNRRVWWTMQSNPIGDDCDFVYVYHLDYGIKPSGVYTTLGNKGELVPSVSNPNNYQYWQPSALAFFNGQMVVGHTLGLIFQTDPNTKTDPKFDLTTAQTNWNTVAIPYSWASCAMDFGTHFQRKYATKINVMGKDVGNFQMQVNSNSDNDRVVGQLAPVNYVNNLVWGDATVIWGGASYVWEEQGKSDFWRRFPAGSLRYNIKQVQFTNAFIGVYRYEDYPLYSFATLSGVAKTATIATPPGFTNIVWPTDAVDMYLATSLDGFVQTWLIIPTGPTPNVPSNVLTVYDPGNTFPTATNLEWVIRGYKKNQRVAISSYVVHFSMLGDKNSQYTGPASSGENTA